ncbi:MAG: M1 family peptidase, partial [Bacteroidetes bacterium]|nr:M1 family peptidase [Bacteroidota bacterium]
MSRSLLPALLLFLYHFSSAQATDPRRELLDIEHYRFNITLTDDNDSIRGEAVVSVKFLRDQQAFDLDLVGAKPDGKGMTVSSVMEGDAKIHFSQTEGKLHIDAGGNTGDTHWFIIRYAGVPADGLIIAKNKYGHRTFFADNWPDRAHHWFPCVDHPSDKASVEFIVTAPEHYQVVSNGVKLEETNLPGHMRLTHWQETVALPTKIMVIGVADFAVGYAGDAAGVPVYSWVYPEDREKGFYDYAL